MYFSEYFVEAMNRVAKYKEKTIYQCEIYNLIGKRKIKFNFISANSIHKQGIVLDLRNFKGNIYNNIGQKFDIPKQKNPTLNITEIDLLEDIELIIDMTEGFIAIYNAGIEKIGKTELLRYGAFGCAMQIEELSKTKKIYYCNDFENDDDFDDLIFEMEILEQ